MHNNKMIRNSNYDTQFDDRKSIGYNQLMSYNHKKT